MNNILVYFMFSFWFHSIDCGYNLLILNSLKKNKKSSMKFGLLIRYCIKNNVGPRIYTYMRFVIGRQSTPFRIDNLKCENNIE